MGCPIIWARRGTKTLSNFPTWWDFCQRPENDGHADDTADDGAGATRWGWTIPTWRDASRYLGHQDVSVVAFNTMTQDGAALLAHGYFWNRLGGNKMNAGPDVSIIDWAFTSGGAIIEIQQELGFVPENVDGFIGPMTIGAINAEAPMSLIENIYVWRVAYYDACGFRGRFPGLYTRAAHCRDLSLTSLAHQ